MRNIFYCFWGVVYGRMKFSSLCQCKRFFNERNGFVNSKRKVYARVSGIFNFITERNVGLRVVPTSDHTVVHANTLDHLALRILYFKLWPIKIALFYTRWHIDLMLPESVINYIRRIFTSTIIHVTNETFRILIVV